MSIVTRFAPSPTGYLHLGHAYSALFAERKARTLGGNFLLRIEDIDTTRCRQEFVAAILEDLAWLSIVWDDEVRVQSRHMAEYREVVANLRERGLLYPCFCSRRVIRQEAAKSLSAPQGPGVLVYPGTCRRLPRDQAIERAASGEPHVWRLDMTLATQSISGLSFWEEGEGRTACHPEVFGDVVLARKDVPASYHLCVTHDDATQGVTLVTRGKDLQPMTAVHRLLQHLMSWRVPNYAHHKILVDEAGKRLAKRHDALSLRMMRAQGISAAEVRAMVGFAD